jgi:hypothetical protein
MTLHTLVRCQLPRWAGWYPLSVQFIRQRSLGNEACSLKLSNGRGQSKGAEVRRLLER